MLDSLSPSASTALSAPAGSASRGREHNLCPGEPDFVNFHVLCRTLMLAAPQAAAALPATAQQLPDASIDTASLTSLGHNAALIDSTQMLEQRALQLSLTLTAHPHTSDAQSLDLAINGFRSDAMDQSANPAEWGLASDGRLDRASHSQLNPRTLFQALGAYDAMARLARLTGVAGTSHNGAPLLTSG
jgi:hypothetical protein